MKIINNIVKITLIFCLSFTLIKTPQTKAKTLGELQNELNEKKQELENNKQQQKLTENEMNTINNTLKTIQDNISKIQIETTELEDEIANLNEEIIKKQEEIKKIINYFQISSGESAYLEYVMGAQDFTDFIYRSAVTEQMTNYNDQLIDEFNATIQKNEEKKQQLQEKKVELGQQQTAMKEQYKKLGESLTSYGEEEVLITDEVKSLQEMVQIYIKKGCKSNEDIATCGQNQQIIKEKEGQIEKIKEEILSLKNNINQKAEPNQESKKHEKRM